MVTASALVPLWNRGAEWARRRAMVQDARTFLYLSTFYVEYDEYGVVMLAELLAAQRRGVAVNLLIDTFGQRLGGVLMSRERKAALDAALQELQRAGAGVARYRPAWAAQRWLGGGQHIKIQVSDAGEALFGSSNITRSSFEGWNEYAVALRGPIVRTLLESYRDIGGTVDEAHLRQLDEVAEPQTADLAREYWVCNPNATQGVFGPLGWRGSNLVTDRLVERIAAAQRSIAMTSFYFKPVEPLLAAIVGAAGRGVHVEVHHSHRDALPATELAWIAAAASYDRLLAAGVHVYENRRGEHSKIVLVDDDWVAFGSYNFEHAAHDRLAEAMIASRDTRATAPAAAIFEGLRHDRDNVRVTRDVLEQLSARLKTKRAFLGPFKRWM